MSFLFTADTFGSLQILVPFIYWDNEPQLKTIVEVLIGIANWTIGLFFEWTWVLDVSQLFALLANNNLTRPFVTGQTINAFLLILPLFVGCLLFYFKSKVSFPLKFASFSLIKFFSIENLISYQGFFILTHSLSRIISNFVEINLVVIFDPLSQ